MRTHRGADCVCFEGEDNGDHCPCNYCCGGSPCHQLKECQHCREEEIKEAEEST